MSSGGDFLSIPGSNGDGGGIGKQRAATFTTEGASDEDIRLGSRVTFNDQSVNIETGEEQQISFAVDDKPREQWDNKMQFYMGIISYAVGLGNVWRFPYLCQKNGGGAFLVPYIIMMALGGLPLFLIELGIGQRLRTGPIGVWNAIHPYLGGLGVSAAIVSYLVALYYNVIITWCVYYLGRSFTLKLPWGECPTTENGTIVEECRLSSSTTMYFWNRQALDTSGNIGELDGFTTHITISLFIAWVVVYLCVMKGIKSSGKVMYATATFPYVVTTIFLIRGLMLDGALDGLVYMTTPDLSRLASPMVWLDAATQIFYSMGLGFGGLIAFGSYCQPKNNCIRDAKWLSLVNLLTSLYTAVVVFCVLGYMAHNNMSTCIQQDMLKMVDLFPQEFTSLAEVQAKFSREAWIELTNNKFTGPYSTMATHSEYCDYHKIITNAAEGTGLAFVVFTEAILKFPFPPFWSILFFLMLLSLGLGSMFGTLEGVITSLNDSRIITVSKPVLTAVLCGSACIIGLVFSSRAGQYWVTMFDQFAGSYALMCVAFFEVVAVIYIYGYNRFARDIEFMTGQTPHQFWLITWRFVTPIIMLVLFITSCIQCFSQLPIYFAYDPKTATFTATEYPIWALFIAFGMVVLAIGPVPLVYFFRKFKIFRFEADIPAASKCLNTTPSTTYMMKSQQSFNRMSESTATFSELPTEQNGRPRS